MSINFMAPESEADLKPRIVVVGVGGAGGNAVNNMIRSNLEGVEFLVANTDAQAIKHSQADRKIQLGATVTQGLGAGARPEIGREAMTETLEETLEHLRGANMVFITAGMGGGTGTGAAPVLAQACREEGMLTVGVVTKPFQFEGAHRMRSADAGIEELQQFVDTLIIIPNQNLFRVANEKTTFADAFKMADDVLYSGVRGVTDLMVMPGLINLDFADIRTVMSEMGKAMMGTGEAEGDNRAILAAESAISNPLLEDVSMHGARGVLINITGGGDMTLFEVDEAANRIREEVDADANIIFGSTFDENLEGLMRVSVVATGIEGEAGVMPRPAPRAAVTPLRPRKIEPVEDPVDEIAQASVVEAAVDAPIIEESDPYEDTVETAQAEPMTEEPEQIDIETAVAEKQDASQAPALFDDPAPRDTSAEETHQDEPAAAAPEAARPKDAFIPPRPVRPEELKRPTRDPEPFREADLMNAGEGVPRVSGGKPKQSLFSRVTGLGLTGAKTDAPKTPAAAAAAPEPIMGRREPQASGVQPAPQAPTSAPAQAAPQATRQAPEQSPAQKQPEADLAPSRADEEMLEIPAFLRRQAN